MLISPDQEALIGRVFEAYLTEYHHGDILHLIEDTTEETHRPVVVNAMTLFEANMEVGDYFNAYPNEVLAIFDKVLHRKGLELSESGSPKHYGEKEERTKERMRRTLHVRITGLPVCPELTRDMIPRSRDVGHFLSVTGTVIRTSVAKVLEYEREYMCTKCRHIFTVEADFDQFYTFVPPVACPNPDACNSYKFSCLSGGSEPAACRDFQEIKIQEQVQRLSVGSIPRSMVVVLEDDLVDSCKSGDDVTVYGVMCQRWKPFYDGTRCDTELVLKANNIEVNNQLAAASFLMNDVQKEFDDFWMSYKHDPIAGRNQILLSICPQVFGMYVIKLAVAMVLAGGVQRIDSSGTKIRGECHMLLVGDPGTGKSQFLKYAAKIMPRSVLTAGIGSTSAGLTVAAVKDGGDWHLEAGALVLSDGGLCCIDEFNSIKEHDRISIHEAMEQQSISVAKAGMVCKLNTRTTILAATNPKGQYNPNEPLSVNVALASPLLSRFDLVLVLLDTRNAEWDHIISSFILEDRGLPAESASLWSMEKIKAYFSVIKRLQPQVSEEAQTILTRYYQLQRQSDGRNAARTTIRMLESLSRLAEAHAKLMYRETVTIEDAVIAVSVMECSMQGGALLGNVNALLTSFPDDPSQQYQNQCQILLEGLNLPLLLQKEMDRQAKLKSNTSEASQFEPPVDDYQHQPRDTNIINKTRCLDITNNCKGDVTVESGLDWFLSITPSLSDGMTSSIITSAQGNLNRKQSWSEMSTVTKQQNCQTKDIPSNTGSSLNHNVISNPIETVTSEENGKSEKNENIKEKSLNEKQIDQSKKLEDKKHADSAGCVIQKVSKNLIDRRRELDLNQRQSDKAGGGERHGERLMSGDTTKNCLLNNLVQDNLLSGQDSRLEKEDEWDQARTKNISTLLNENMAVEAETEKQLNAKFSGYKFKPRKMRPLVHNLNASPDVSTEFQNYCNPGSRDPHANKECKISKQKPDSHDDSPVPFTNREKNKRQNQYQVLLEGEKQLNCVSEVGEKGAKTSSFISKELDKYDFSFGKGKLAHDKTVGRIKGSDNTENLGQKQRTRHNTCNETNLGTCVQPLKPTTCINDQAPSKSSHTKSTLALSTLAKLSSFSFNSTTEFPIAAQTEVEKNPTAVGKRPLNRQGAECSRANSKDRKTLNPPENSPLLRKINTVITMGKVKDILPALARELTQEQEHESGKELQTETKCKAKQTEPTRAANHVSVNMGKVGLVDYETTTILKKRKCFELGSPLSRIGGSEGSFSRLSLPGFVELGNDVFDTDWDKEVSKRAKI
ncbi:DNA helicase MCM9 isoform X2 [Etheostoma cragini]|uniref:DNA helicase MCM9 isoform X2 n=1 Tax=Etheostoma cragini TaxID=417921 RepID=UPI00155DF15E|nr:DNA helicase MCM9 isoform X2 [Etheostoma cragini]